MNMSKAAMRLKRRPGLIIAICQGRLKTFLLHPFRIEASLYDTDCLRLWRPYNYLRCFNTIVPVCLGLFLDQVLESLAEKRWYLMESGLTMAPIMILILHAGKIADMDIGLVL